MMELVNPTGLIQEIWHDLIEPRRQFLLEIIHKIIGTQASDEAVLFCEMSIISQCRALLNIRRSDIEYLLGQPLCPELIKRLARHIADFSLAGIRVSGNAKS